VSLDEASFKKCLACEDLCFVSGLSRLVRRVSCPSFAVFINPPNLFLFSRVFNLITFVNLGKITKLLSLRPPEILSLIAEAAGTNMFDERKKKADAQMLKKERLLASCQEEISMIQSKLDKLREQKSDALEVQKLKAEVETLTNLKVSMEWKKANERLAVGEKEMTKRKAEVEQVQAGLNKLNNEVGNMEAEIERIQKERVKVGCRCWCNQAVTVDGWDHRNWPKEVKSLS
jgi:DNA repair exonuclease SbcCD ATPase subunit